MNVLNRLVSVLSRKNHTLNLQNIQQMRESIQEESTKVKNKVGSVRYADLSPHEMFLKKELNKRRLLGSEITNYIARKIELHTGNKHFISVDDSFEFSSALAQSYADSGKRVNLVQFEKLHHFEDMDLIQVSTEVKEGEDIEVYVIDMNSYPYGTIDEIKQTSFDKKSIFISESISYIDDDFGFDTRNIHKKKNSEIFIPSVLRESLGIMKHYEFDDDTAICFDKGIRRIDTPCDLFYYFDRTGEKVGFSKGLKKRFYFTNSNDIPLVSMLPLNVVHNIEKDPLMVCNEDDELLFSVSYYNNKFHIESLIDVTIEDYSW